MNSMNYEFFCIPMDLKHDQRVIDGFSHQLSYTGTAVVLGPQNFSVGNGLFTCKLA